MGDLSCHNPNGGGFGMAGIVETLVGFRLQQNLTFITCLECLQLVSLVFYN